MKNREVSLRGKLVRDMMKNMMDSAMGHKMRSWGWSILKWNICVRPESVQAV